MRLSFLTTPVLTTLLLSTSALAQAQGHGEAHSSMHSSQSSQPMMGHGAMESSPHAAKAPFDLQFLDTMLAHHQSAIEMAQLVEDRSAHDELKQMGKKMIEAQHKEIKELSQKVVDDQKKEIAQMAKWKKDWKLARK